MVGAIIQARMGSTRLPGKVLMDICSKPLLWHVIERLKNCKNIQKIVVATTEEKEDDKIESFCIENKIECYRGSSENVLERFIEAGKKFKIDIIVRVCSDSPLIDPKSIDEMVNMLKHNNADLVTVNPEKTSLLDGFEVTTLEFLQKIKESATEKYHFEHVTYLAKEKNMGKILFYEPEENLKFKDIRITVDTIEDLTFIREVYNKLYQDNKIVDIREISNLPFHIFRINREITQKKPEEKNFLVNIIVEKTDDKIEEFVNILKKNPSIIVKTCKKSEEIEENNKLINIRLKYIS